MAKESSARSNQGKRARQLSREVEEARRVAVARRTRLLVGGAVALVIVIIASAAAVYIHGEETAIANATAPPGSTPAGGFLYQRTHPSRRPPVRVVLDEDFQCPVCRRLEASAGSYLDAQVRAGAISLEFRPVAVLDGSSGYSSDSASAAACTFENAGIRAYVALHSLLFAHQPPEGSDGLSDDELTSYAEQAGASNAVRSCIDDHTYRDWAKKVTTAFDHSVDPAATPTVLVDGREVHGATAGSAPGLADLRRAITAAG